MLSATRGFPMALPDGCAIGCSLATVDAELPEIPLEQKLQSELNGPGASGSEQRVLPRGVGRLARTERPCTANGGVVRIRENRVIQNVEDFHAKLSRKPFFYRKVLEEGKIPVAEAIVAEEIPRGGSIRAG